MAGKLRHLEIGGERAFACPECGGFPDSIASAWCKFSGDPTAVCECAERLRRSRHEPQRSALYAAVVADRYARLVESSEPADAMREAIRKAEGVVKVWEEVVSEK